MQSAGKQEYQSDEYLATMSTVFGMNTMVDAQDYANMAGTSSLSPHTHSRNISSDSVSSLVERTQLSRTHPSLPGYRGSPNGQFHQELPVPDRRYLAPPPAAVSVQPYTRSRRRATPPSDDDDDVVEELNPDATEQERAEFKRRQNTLAARRSRRRRLAQFHKLEEDVARLNRERDIWKERALMMERMLSTHGLPCPNFSER